MALLLLELCGDLDELAFANTFPSPGSPPIEPCSTIQPLCVIVVESIGVAELGTELGTPPVNGSTVYFPWPLGLPSRDPAVLEPRRLW